MVNKPLKKRYSVVQLTIVKCGKETMILLLCISRVHTRIPVVMKTVGRYGTDSTVLLLVVS